VPFPHHARRRLAGCFLVASDIDWVAGHGALVEGTMGQLLLLLTGRTVVLRDLAGEGVPRLVAGVTTGNGPNGRWTGRNAVC
jgi:hypothetical protein